MGNSGNESDVQGVAAPASPAVVAGPDATDDDGPFDPDVANQIEALFKEVVDSRTPPGTKGVKRAVFLKPHGCAKATFRVAADLAPALRQGLFAEPGAYDAWLRLSSDTDPATSDFNDNTVGVAVKVLNVPGLKVLPGEEDFMTQDFVLQNHPVFFVDTAQDFLSFTKAAFAGAFNDYLKKHPVTERVLQDMAKRSDDVLGGSYWSTMPSRFGGVGTYVKYKLVPCAPVTVPPDRPGDDPNYLRTRLVTALAQAPACFQLQVQVRQGSGMPLDQATALWSEDVAPPQTVATVELPTQDVASHDQDCEAMSFTAWHTLPAHQPVGSISKAREIIYKKLADYRRKRNGVAIAEPQ